MAEKQIYLVGYSFGGAMFQRGRCWGCLRYSIQPARAEQREVPSLGWNFHFVKIFQDENAYLTSG